MRERKKERERERESKIEKERERESKMLPDEPLETVIEAAIDDKIHDAVEDEESVVDAG